MSCKQQSRNIRPARSSRRSHQDPAMSLEASTCRNQTKLLHLHASVSVKHWKPRMRLLGTPIIHFLGQFLASFLLQALQRTTPAQMHFPWCTLAYAVQPWTDDVLAQPLPTTRANTPTASSAHNSGATLEGSLNKTCQDMARHQTSTYAINTLWHISLNDLESLLGSESCICQASICKSVLVSDFLQHPLFPSKV